LDAAILAEWDEHEGAGEAASSGCERFLASSEAGERIAISASARV
jgi:hypothetical protein